MKLLIVTTSYPDDSDGAAAAGVFVRDFALALVEQGHQVSVIAKKCKEMGSGLVMMHLLQN
jgi:hypothetical protein